MWTRFIATTQWQRHQQAIPDYPLMLMPADLDEMADKKENKLTRLQKLQITRKYKK